MSLTEDYARDLAAQQGASWKRILDVQAPYRWNLRRIGPGFMLDVGCGVGRNLVHVRGRGVGVDPNPACVAAVRALGFSAFAPEDFNAEPESFDSLLFAHVLEHVPRHEAESLIATYLPYLKMGGMVILMTPQEAGFKRDKTHVSFLDQDALRSISSGLGLRVVKDYSFPFPRIVGKIFPYNEFVVLAEKITDAMEL